MDLRLLKIRKSRSRYRVIWKIRTKLTKRLISEWDTDIPKGVVPDKVRDKET